MDIANFTRPYRRKESWATDVYGNEVSCKICGKPIGKNSVVCNNRSSRNPISGISHISCAKKYINDMKKKDPEQYSRIEIGIKEIEHLTIAEYFTYVDMKNKKEDLRIVEGVESVWHYHLSESGETARPALCGNARVMATKLPLANWGRKDGHIPSSYCKTCDHMYQRDTPKKK